MSNIETNLKLIRDNVAGAADRAGRDVTQIRLVAISKGHPAEAVRTAYELGLRVFGENRAGEGVDKIQTLGDLTGIGWHMVGHIQSRKAGQVAAHFDFVHSVDREKIARRLSQARDPALGKLPVLIECNVSGEESKGGWRLEDERNWPSVVRPLAEISRLENLEVVGLMTMAPLTDDESIVRNTFRRLRDLQAFLKREVPRTRWDELSMGMTDDYPIAIEEGATMIRLGRAVFGPRRM